MTTTLVVSGHPCELCVRLSSEHVLVHSIILIHPYKKVEYAVFCLIDEGENFQDSMN